DKKYKTIGGRTVYGGGGIMPDVYVPLDTSSFTHNVTRLYLDGRFNAFVYQYYITNLPQFQQFKTPAEFAAKYQNTAEAWSELVAYALKDSIYLSKIPQVDKTNIEQRIKAYLARLKWRNQGFFEVYNTFDPIFKKGKEVIKK
ncbi:MAG TPA: carboxyl-terminal protease, partial [Flavisolibacter sp.]